MHARRSFAPSCLLAFARSFPPSETTVPHAPYPPQLCMRGNFRRLEILPSCPPASALLPTLRAVTRAVLTLTRRKPSRLPPVSNYTAEISKAFDPMYPAKGDDRSSTSTISRSSSSDSSFDDDSGHAAAVQLPSVDDRKQRSSTPCPGWWPCAPGGRRMAVLALVCAIAAAASVSRWGGCLVGLRKANGGSTSCPRGNKREEAEANASLEVEVRAPRRCTVWCIPTANKEDPPLRRGTLEAVCCFLFSV